MIAREVGKIAARKGKIQRGQDPPLFCQCSVAIFQRCSLRFDVCGQIIAVHILATRNIPLSRRNVPLYNHELLDLPKIGYESKI